MITITRISGDSIMAVRAFSEIAEIIGEHVQLRNAGGGSLKGLCPFHEEKTPSLHVSPERGLWFCFSCAEGGDVIKFVQKVHDISFTAAAELLAHEAGLAVAYEPASTPGWDSCPPCGNTHDHACQVAEDCTC